MVNEWTFQKDGVDVEMRDISNDTKSAQLDSRDTFLGVGQNRCCQLRAGTCKILWSGLGSTYLSAARLGHAVQQAGIAVLWRSWCQVAACSSSHL